MACSLAPAQCRDNYNVPRRSRTIGEAAAATRPRAVRVVKLESGRSRGPRGGYRLTLSQRGRPVRSASTWVIALRVVVCRLCNANPNNM